MSVFKREREEPRRSRGPRRPPARAPRPVTVEAPGGAGRFDPDPPELMEADLDREPPGSLPAGSARPGRAVLQRGLDPGLAVVRWVYDALSVDAEWSVWQERGFTWWAHGHAQQVWSEPGYDDEGFEIYRLHARGELVRDAVLDPGRLELLGALNRLCALSALVADPGRGTVEYRASMWVHEESVDWVARVFQFVVAIQAEEAERIAATLADVLEGADATSAHPRSGERSEPDDMLGVIDHVARHGLGPSSWAGEDLEAFLELLDRNPYVVLASGGEEGAAIEYPYGDGTCLIQVDTRERHPMLGGGVFVRLSLLDDVAEGEGGAFANELNRRELRSLTRSHLLGSWVVVDGTPTFVAFYPSDLNTSPGLLTTLLLSTSLRARWAAEGLRGDDWIRPGRLDEARETRLRRLSGGSAP